MTSPSHRLFTQRRLLWVIAVLLAANLAMLGWLAARAYLHHRDRFLEQAESDLLAGHLEQGVAALQAHLQLQPGDTAAGTRLAAALRQYRAQLQSRAKAAISVDDRIAAVANLKQYLILTPDDADVQVRLADLYEDAGNHESAERIYRRVLGVPDLEKKNPRTYARARNRLYKLVNQWANAVKRRADALDDQGDSRSAAALYEQVIALRARNPALETRTTDRTLALRALDAVVARRAYALWRAGAAPEDALRTAYDEKLAAASPVPAAFLSRRIAARRTRLSDLFWETGDLAAARDDWEAAVKAYDAARRVRPAEQEPVHDLNLAALRYNQAMGEFRLGHYASSLRLLEDLSTRTPEYENNKVTQLLVRVRAKLKSDQPPGGAPEQTD